MAEDDFIARALSSLSHQMTLANTGGAAGGEGTDEDKKIIEAHAQSLVDNDAPKIDSAVKSYLSLVAARSVVASEIDVLSENVKSCDHHQQLNTMGMKDALTCARKLLNGINTTLIPKVAEEEVPEEKDNDNNKSNEEHDEIKDNVTRIVWNRLVALKNKDMKPSKIFGRKTLIVVYPFIEERFRRGLEKDGDGLDNAGSTNNAATSPQSYSTELLPAIDPPLGIDKDSWISFYTEFGALLRKACQNDIGNKKEGEEGEQYKDDDSKLLWSDDKGVKELQERRDRRSKRAEILTQTQSSNNEEEKT
ncbi:hypothetical protein ACHAWC_002861 [Mediolabrus comicus]